MTPEIDPKLEAVVRRRIIELAGWREVIVHGTQAERKALVDSLREVDLIPLASTLAEDEAEVRASASRHRKAIALDELRLKTQEAIVAGDLDQAATWLDLRLSVEDSRMRD